MRLCVFLVHSECNNVSQQLNVLKRSEETTQERVE